MYVSCPSKPINSHIVIFIFWHRRFVLQFALAVGATVIMASSSDDKLKIVEKLGAHHSINYITTPNWAEEVMNIVRSSYTSEGICGESFNRVDKRKGRRYCNRCRLLTETPEILMDWRLSDRRCIDYNSVGQGMRIRRMG
jgi:hypothetical protein